MAARLAVSLISLILTLAPSPLLFSAVSQTPAVSAESERYAVEALDTGGIERPARVIVSDHVTSRKHMVMVNSTLGELKRATIRDDQQRVILVCTKGFAVLDPSGLVNTDEVYGLDGRVAPGGRWIAYRRFFPPTHPGPSEGILVYDTKQSRTENHSAYPIAAEREWRAGYAIYPPGEEWRDANAVLKGDDAYQLTSALDWEGSPDAPILLFSIRRGSRDTVVLARPSTDRARTCWSDLPGSAERWRVKTLKHARTGDTVVVTASSSAIANAAQATISFPENCNGSISPTTDPYLNPEP
jgi:hypothetical protein